MAVSCSNYPCHGSWIPHVALQFARAMWLFILKCIVAVLAMPNSVHTSEKPKPHCVPLDCQQPCNKGTEAQLHKYSGEASCQKRPWPLPTNFYNPLLSHMARIRTRWLTIAFLPCRHHVSSARTTVEASAVAKLGVHAQGGHGEPLLYQLCTFPMEEFPPRMLDR